MRARLANLRERLVSSYWFIPAGMSLAAIACAFALVELDETLEVTPVQAVDWLYKNRPEGAREVLSTIAGSMITVAGVVFSITIVALSLASSQFGPRVLRQFMRDRGNQFVFGTFVSTFLYCLMVLRTIRSLEGDPFVPHTALSVGILLAVVSIGVLIYFIHHVAQSVQVSNIIHRISIDLEKAIGRMFPEQLGQGVEDSTEETVERIQRLLPPGFADAARPVKSRAEGYVEAIEEEAVLDCGRKRDLLLRVKARPGQFIKEEDVLVLAWPGERVTDEVENELSKAFLIGPTPTMEQDVEFPAQQLVEIAVRALSPSLNDPITAVSCIYRLAAALRRVAARRLPSPDRYDQENNLRLLADPVSFATLLELAFGQIAHHGRSNPAIVECLLRELAELALHLHRKSDRAAVQWWAAHIRDLSRGEISNPSNQAAIEERFQAILEALARAT